MKTREDYDIYPFGLEDDSDVLFSYKEYPRPYKPKPLSRKKRKELAIRTARDLAYFASPEWSKKRRRIRMTIKEIRLFAETKGISLPKRAKKADLIHLIQQAEGNEACYGTKQCDNTGCLWHQDCIKAKEKGHSIKP